MNLKNNQVKFMKNCNFLIKTHYLDSFFDGLYRI